MSEKLRIRITDIERWQWAYFSRRDLTVSFVEAILTRIWSSRSQNARTFSSLIAPSDVEVLADVAVTSADMLEERRECWVQRPEGKSKELLSKFAARVIHKRVINGVRIS